MKKEITWITGDKREARVVVELVTSKVLDADGDKITVGCCELMIEATIDGYLTGIGIHYIDHPVAVARIGKLGIAADNMATIEAAVAEIKSTPEWIAREAREAQNRKDSIAYDKHRAMMRKIMGY